MQVTELLFRGVLECEEPTALAVIFTALIHEDRRPGPPRRVPKRFYPSLRSQTDKVIRQLRTTVASADVDDLPKSPDWGMTPVVIEWMNGATFDELLERFDIGPGDVCRVLRMTVQLMRQVRRAIDPDWDVYQVNPPRSHRGTNPLALRRDRLRLAPMIIWHNPAREI